MSDDQHDDAQNPEPAPRKPQRWETLARFEGRITERQNTRLKTLRRKLTEANRKARAANPSTRTRLSGDDPKRQRCFSNVPSSSSGGRY